MPIPQKPFKVKPSSLLILLVDLDTEPSGPKRILRRCRLCGKGSFRSRTSGENLPRMEAAQTETILATKRMNTITLTGKSRKEARLSRSPLRSNFFESIGNFQRRGKNPVSLCVRGTAPDFFRPGEIFHREVKLNGSVRGISPSSRPYYLSRTGEHPHSGRNRLKNTSVSRYVSRIPVKSLLKGVASP